MLTDNKKIYVAQENNSSVQETEYSDMCEQKLYAFEWEFYTNVSIIVFRIFMKPWMADQQRLVKPHHVIM